MPEVYTCELDPDTKTYLKMFLFKDVQNVETIRGNIIKGIWKCAIIKPSLILDSFQVAVAANKAVLSEKLNSMVTKTVYAEILYNLSLTKNITQSLSKFGIEKDRNLLVSYLVTKENDESKDINAQIEGELCSISDLVHFTDLQSIKQTYKLDKLSCDEDLLDIIVSKIVTKNFVSH